MKLHRSARETPLFNFSLSTKVDRYPMLKEMICVIDVVLEAKLKKKRLECFLHLRGNKNGKMPHNEEQYTNLAM